METLNNDLGSSERKANIEALIGRLIKSKKELLDEIKSDFDKPEFQATLKKLRKINERQSVRV